MSPQTRRAAWLIEQAKRKGSAQIDRLDALENTIRDLCADLAVMYGDDLTVSKGCEIAELIFGDGTAQVEFEYRAGYPAKLYGPPENCYPAEDEEITILRAYLHGRWHDAELFSQAVLESWDSQISELAVQNAEDRKHGEFE